MRFLINDFLFNSVEVACRHKLGITFAFKPCLFAQELFTVDALSTRLSFVKWWLLCIVPVLTSLEDSDASCWRPRRLYFHFLRFRLICSLVPCVVLRVKSVQVLQVFLQSVLVVLRPVDYALIVLCTELLADSCFYLWGSCAWCPCIRYIHLNLSRLAILLSEWFIVRQDLLKLVFLI